MSVKQIGFEERTTLEVVFEGKEFGVIVSHKYDENNSLTKETIDVYDRAIDMRITGTELGKRVLEYFDEVHG